MYPVCENIWQRNFAGLENFATFAVAKLSQANCDKYISDLRNKAGLSCGVIPLDCESLATLTRKARLLFTYLSNVFRPMPNSSESRILGNNSTQAATSAHDTSNTLSIKFQIEMQAKNKAYAFILSHGLLSEFIEFSRAYSGDCQSIESRLEMILKNCYL